MLEQKIIKHSTSPWSAPFWVVPKKVDASGKQKWRIVIDYRKLNDVTIGDAYQYLTYLTFVLFYDPRFSLRFPPNTYGTERF